jgi:tetratricopeptide (TPR) repeat protein
MRPVRAICLLGPVIVAACSANPDKHTLSELHAVPADVQDVVVEDGLDQAIKGYRSYLDETPESALTPEAMRRLADLKVEKEYGIRGDGKLLELPAPVAATPATELSAGSTGPTQATGIAEISESEQAFEQRAAREQPIASPDRGADLELPEGEARPSLAGPLEAIELYDRILATYPRYEHNDQVLYQKARAYDELGHPDEAMGVMDRLINDYPYSYYIDEVQFRRAEYFFTRRKYTDAENAYSAIITLGDRSEYYELALYKLGWTLYKQEFYDEALDKYIALLDHKVSIGYDFDAPHEEADERRVGDTFRVISLSFSNLGGTEVVNEYFAAKGKRSYEDRIYSNLGEFYLTKLRYHDAAAAYKAFVALYPFHRTSPRFSMRVVEIYTKGGFQKLVLDSKKEFAKTYGLKAEYWRHFPVEESPEVLSYLKSNLRDLANHYHAQYQVAELADERPANYQEALLWYREFLSSFPEDPESPAINYQLADLLLEEKNYGEAAREYERTAYNYPPHEKASGAGYAAIFAHRENLKVAPEEQKEVITREAVASSLRFADAFPEHEQAPTVLGAAADDLYDLKEFGSAIDAARKLIERYPATDLEIGRSAWTVVAHSSFELAEYPQAESAYTRVLELTPQDDDKRQALVDNLAASIYKQGEQANELQDYRAAADHFLRIRQAAPTSQIRAAAEYDAGAALIRLEDWTAAAEVLEEFRRTYPEHELNREATKQIASVYQQSGQVTRAAGEYERIAAEADTPELRAEALLVAGDLHEQSKNAEGALAVYLRYVEEFPQPLERGIETRSKIAEIYKAKHDDARYHEQLQKIVSIDATSGTERTDRTRFLGAKSALVLAEGLYEDFAAVKLVLPFERSLQEKQQRMDTAIKAFNGLVEYEVGEVTAAATFYMAEVYYGFNRALLESERPANLKASDVENYELGLEENAFPFEEKAIAVHEKNLELIRAGIYNAWIDKSLAKLAQLMPARYAKDELSGGFLGSIDRYAYRAPAASLSDIAAVEGEQGVRADASKPDGSSTEVAAEPSQSGETVTAAGVADAVAQ